MPVSCCRLSEIEELFDLRHGIFWTLDSVTDGSRILVDLPVVSTLEGLVTEEVDILEVDSRASSLGGFCFDML